MMKYFIATFLLVFSACTKEEVKVAQTPLASKIELSFDYHQYSEDLANMSFLVMIPIKVLSNSFTTGRCLRFISLKTSSTY